MVRFGEIIIAIGGLSTDVLGQPKQWSSTDCRGPSITPRDYDLTNVTQQMLDPNFISQLQSTCATDGGGQYNDPGGCKKMINRAEDVIYTLYATSDADLIQIYLGMFGCTNPVNPPLYNMIMNDYQTLVGLNQTVFGVSAGSASKPGLMRNLMTLLDGIEAIEAVSAGQMTSLTQAATSQQQATQGIQAQILATADSLKQQTLDFMTMLVANRTMVQKHGYQEIGQSVRDAIKQIETEADDISSTASSDFAQLQSQYQQWTGDTNIAMQDVTTRSQTLSSNANTLKQLASSTVKALQTSETGVANAAFSDAVTGFNSELIAAQDQVGADVSQLSTDMSNLVSQNANSFAADLSALSSDLSADLASTNTDVNNNPTLLSNTAEDTNRKAQVALSNLATVVSSTVLPLIANVQGAVDSVVTLRSAISAAQSQLTSDIAAIRNPAQQAATTLGKQVSSVFAGYQTDFDSQFATIRSQMLTNINSKVAAGRSSLSQILTAVTSTQGGAANQQQMEGSVSRTQAGASITAADLTKAQAQNSADHAQAGLDSMVGLVGGALADAQDTLQAVGAANVGKITGLTSQLQAGQRAATDRAYSQLNDANDISNSMARDTQADGNAAQLSAINLQNSLQQAGASLQGSVAFQNNQAQKLLSDVNGILQLAQQYGGSLADQMSNFEKQMPALYNVLVSKIKAYQALMSSQGAQAQSGASNAVAADASDSLSNLVSRLQSITSNTTGTTTGLAAQQAATAADAASVIRDIQMLNGKLTQQGVAGAGAVSSLAQKAAAQTNAQVQSASQHSAAAITALMQYNADLVKSTQADVLDSGSAAMNSALNAANYLTRNAQNYVNLSNQFVLDAQNVENAGQVNLTAMLNTLNATLVSVTNSAQMYQRQMQEIGADVTAWPGQIGLEASNINAAIQAKIAEITSAIVNMDGISDSTSTQKVGQELQNYIDQLNEVYQKQRAAFNRFAGEYALRRIALLTGLNSSVLAQKAAFLQSLASSDLDSSAQAGQTGSVLQGLANAIQAASAQGGMDMSRVAAMVANIGSGVSSLTQSLANQMTTQVSTLKQKALVNGMSVGNAMAGTVNGANSQASLLGNQFAAALSQIGGSDSAIQLAADGSNQDAYTIAGLLNTTSQATRVQIASLLRQVEAGNTTMQAVIDTAQKMSEAQVSTVQDVINAFTSHIAVHVSNVDAFESSVNISAKALNTTANNAVLPHTGLQADVISDIAAESAVIRALRNKLLDGTNGSSVGQIRSILNARGNALQALQNNVTNILYGSSFKSPLASSITNFTSLVQLHPERLSPISALVQANSSSNPTSPPQLTLPDMISQVKVALSGATNNVNQAQANATALITKEVSNANAEIQEILRITASALGVQVPPAVQV